MQYVALLRGVSGNNPAQSMERLRGIFEKMGFTAVRTVIASGNVLFETRASKIAPLEAKIEQALKPTGVSIAMVRTETEIGRLVRSLPFKGKKDSPKAKQNVTFLKVRPKKGVKLPAGAGYKVVQTGHRDVSFVIDLTGTKTPAVMLLLEKAYGKAITTRTWATVLKIERAFSK